MGEPDGPHAILMAEGTQQHLGEKNPAPAKPLNPATHGQATGPRGEPKGGLSRKRFPVAECRRPWTFRADAFGN